MEILKKERKEERKNMEIPKKRKKERKKKRKGKESSSRIKIESGQKYNSDAKCLKYLLFFNTFLNLFFYLLILISTKFQLINEIRQTKKNKYK